MKNDKSTTDLTTKLTGICDQHKLIVTNGAFALFKCHTRYAKLHRTTRIIRSFLFLVQTKFFCLNSGKNGKDLTGELCS